MTPAEHLAEAERLITEVMTSQWDTNAVSHRTKATVALAHAVIAVASELGVPHTTPSAAGPSDGQ